MALADKIIARRTARFSHNIERLPLIALDDEKHNKSKAVQTVGWESK